MKKLFALALAASFALVSLSSMAETIEKDNGFISVNASDSKEIAPNQAEISIGIETSDKSLQKASEDNKLIAQKVYSTLKALLGAQDYIKTSNYSARPEYTYANNKKTFEKYVVTNTVVVKTKNTDLVSKLIDKAISQGATGVENLQFSATNFDNACNDSLSDLTKKAYSQASTVAKSINAQITGIKSITTSCNAESNQRPYGGMMMMKSAMDSASDTPIESGKIKIYANVDASFFVK